MKTLHVNQRTVIALVLCSMFAVSTAAARSPLDGFLTVSNERLRPILITIDGERFGKVQPLSKRKFSYVPNGLRLVEIKFRKSRSTRRISIPVSGQTSMRVKALRGVARITNTSKQRIRVLINGRHVKELRSGEAITSRRLRPGRHQLVAYPSRAGASSQIRQARSFQIEAGEQTSVSIQAFYGAIKVKNPHDRRVALVLDGRRVGRINAFGDMTIAQLEPGMHHLTLRKRGRTLAHAKLRVTAGHVAAWSPRIEQRGRLQVSNHARRGVSVSVEGVGSRWIEPGDTVTFMGLRVGTAHMTVVRRRGKIEERTVHVPRRGTARVNIKRHQRTRVASRHGRIRVVAHN